MSRTKKRILLISVALVLALGCAVLADLVIYRNFGYYYGDTDVQSVFTDGSEAFALSGCEITDGVVIVTGIDPQFVISTNDAEFSRIRIIFREPVSQNTPLQMFYMPAGEGFSENSSVLRTITAGVSEEVITLPKAVYSNLRFDFEQNVTIDRILIGNEARIYEEYKPHFGRMGIIFGIIFVPLCIVIIVKTLKKKTNLINEDS